MNRMILVGGAVAALALWTIAALSALPLAEWPALPWRIDGMSVGQILLAYGLMPRGVLALLAGAALGLAGALMQAVLRNPLAEPGVLGISAGCALGVALAHAGMLSIPAPPAALSGPPIDRAQLFF